MKDVKNRMEKANHAFITCGEALTLPGLFRLRTEATLNAIAYRQYDFLDKKWRNYTWGWMRQKIDCWQTGLMGEGLKAGDRVAVYLKNSVEWVCFEQAALSLRLIVVPVYSLDTPQNIAYILRDSGCRLLLTKDLEQWQALARYQSDLPDLKHVLFLEGAKDTDRSDNVSLTGVVHWLPQKAEAAPLLQVDPHEPATIIYTSGTTGSPKGVVLSHHNILWNAEAVIKVVPAYQDDIFLSFLPLSHTFERTVGYYVPMMAGSRVVFARSVKELAEDFLDVRPTVLISVPRIYERVYGRINEKLKTKGAVAQKMFRMTVETGWRCFEASQGRAASLTLGERILWSVLKPLVARKVLDRLGGRLRLAVTGGAPLHEKVGHFFIGLGLPLVQGYGLTETSPVVSTNTIENNLPASVGPPLPGVEVKIGTDNELLVRSPGVMQGYWNLPEATSEAVDEKGWLHTGDVVEIEDGRIYIRGRLKEILVTSTGEKVPPANLEMCITEDPLFFQAMVTGEGKPYLAVLIVVDRHAWKDFASGLSLDPDDPASLHSPAAVSAVLKKIDALLSSFPSCAQIRAVRLLSDSWAFEQGLVTSLMKLKRHEITKKFNREIVKLYEGHHLPG